MALYRWREDGLWWIFIFDSIRSFDQMRKLTHHRQLRRSHGLALHFCLNVMLRYFPPISHGIFSAIDANSWLYPGMYNASNSSCNDFPFDSLRDRARFTALDFSMWIFVLPSGNKTILGIWCAASFSTLPMAPAGCRWWECGFFRLILFPSNKSTKINYYYCSY